MRLSRALFLLAYWRKRRTRRKHSKRSIWVRPIFVQKQRTVYGAGHSLMLELRQNEMTSHINFFRMNVQLYEELLSLIGPHIMKVDCGREPIDPKIRLGLTIRYLASGDSMTSLSYLFRIGLSTVSTIISETTPLIWEVLRKKVLPTPKEANWVAIADGFADTWNFPNCIGAIDGKHIRIQAPPKCGSNFYNYKGYHSVILLAVADYRYIFTIVDIGATGRQSDGGIIINSEMGKRLRNSNANIPPARVITEGRPALPYVLVGDEAFQLLPNLLKPFPQKNLDIEKRVFNYRLSRARIVIEITFGILSSRWRIFRNEIMAKVENIDNIIKAAVCLHNFLMLRKSQSTYFTPDLVDRVSSDGSVIPACWRRETSILQPIHRIGSNNQSLQASFVRNNFKDYFNSEGAVPWQWNYM